MLSLCCGRRRRSGNQSLSSNEKNWHPVTTTPYRDNDKTWRPESPTPICCCHEDIVRPVIPPGARPPVVNDILALLLAPSDTTESKDLACAELAHASGWSFQSIAEALYEALQKLLANEKIERWGSAIADAYKISVKEAAKIVELADKFANEHPILTGVVLAVIALGILYLTAPILLDWLGFTSVGPRAGSFATSWQPLYGDQVPVGSVFSYLQRLGMTLRSLKAMEIASKLGRVAPIEWGQM